MLRKVFKSLIGMCFVGMLALPAAAGEKAPVKAGFAAAGTVTTYGPPASHHLRWLASANCLLEIPEDVTAIAAGEQVSLWDLSSGGHP